MDAAEQVEEQRKSGGGEERERRGGGGEMKEVERSGIGNEENLEQGMGNTRNTNSSNVEDLERGTTNSDNAHMSMLQRLNPTNPLRIVINSNTRPASVTTTTTTAQNHQIPRSVHHTPQQPVSLNSRAYTNRISLFIFLVQMISAIGLVGFLLYRGVLGLINPGEARSKEKRVLQYFLPQVEAASFLSITLAFIWQKAFRVWPKHMVYIILWGTFIMSLAAGILLICFQKPSTDGVGVCFIAFSICNGLYACWVARRIKFCIEVLIKSLEPVKTFPGLNHPTYWMLLAGFVWMSLWILAVIGALNFYLPPLVIIALVLSLAWTAEVMRNVANLTVSRVIALYYLRGMQSNTKFCFQRAVSKNLGSACLGSLFVPAIEALRIFSRGLNLLEGEDEFMFSCAHCCLKVMDSIFRYGNSWAFVQIAAYGKGFVRASQDTWELFEKREMVQIVDSDMTSSICFLTGVCSGCICLIVVAAWTHTVHKSFTATISLLAFFVGYLMTRIAMALPHACVSCYYVCYAENPENTRMFDRTIMNRLEIIKSGRDAVVPTPRVPRRFNT